MVDVGEGTKRLPGGGGGRRGRIAESWFSRESIATVFVAGTGFLADSYDLFVINIVTSLMATSHPNPSRSDVTLVKGTALIGAIAGQLFFGAFADYIGRRGAFLLTLTLTVCGSVLSSAVFPLGALNIYQSLAIFRALVGFGIGGEYPLSATIASENSSAEYSGRVMAAVFSLQGVGTLLGAFVPLLCLACGASDEFTWRFSLGFGACPGLALAYFRLRMEETRQFRVRRRNIVASLGAKADNRILILKTALSTPAVLHALAGTALSWFLLDVTFYGNSLFTADIVSDMGFDKGGLDLALSSFIIACIGYPGYLFTVVLIDRVGRKRIQWTGFFMLAALFATMAGFYQHFRTSKSAFFLIYGLTFFFSNFGPNATTYIIPGEIFPPEIRATCHGISAAAGKIGAAITTFFFLAFRDVAGLHIFFVFCAAVALDGLIITIWLIPTYDAEILRQAQEGLLNSYHRHDDGYQLAQDEKEEEPIFRPSERSQHASFDSTHGDLGVANSVTAALGSYVQHVLYGSSPTERAYDDPGAAGERMVDALLVSGVESKHGEIRQSVN